MKKLFIIIVIIFTAFILGGCYDYTELKDYTVVTGIGIDKGKNSRYRVTAELGGISSDGGEVREAQSSVVIHGEADSIMQAVAKLTDTTGGELYFKSCSIAVLGDGLCADGCGDVVEFLLKSTDFPMKISLAASAGRAEEVFAVPPTVDSVISTELLKSIRSAQNELSSSRETAPYEVYDRIARGKTAALPLLSVKKGKPSTVDAGGLRLIKDGKTACLLNAEEAVCLNLIENNAKRAIIECDGSGCEITRCKTSDENGRLSITATALPLDETLTLKRVAEKMRENIESVYNKLPPNERDNSGEIQVLLDNADK